MGQPSHSHTPRPTIHVLSSAVSHGNSSVKSVRAWRHVQGSRVQSVPQNIRRGPKASYTRRMCSYTLWPVSPIHAVDLLRSQGLTPAFVAATRSEEKDQSPGLGHALRVPAP